MTNLIKYKKTQIYIAKETPLKIAPRPEVVALVTKILKEPQYKKIMKFIKRVSIVRSGESGHFVTSGYWKPRQQVLHVKDHRGISVEDYEQTIRHELAHVFYQWATEWRAEELTAWCNVANRAAPISTYVKRHERSFKAENGTWGKVTNHSLFAEEQHSEFASLHSGHPDAISWALNNDELRAAYEALHY